MRAEQPLPHHRLPPAGLAELVLGEGGPDTVGLLLRSERSRRLLLLRMLDEDTDLGPAWDLLSAAQRRSPATVDHVLVYPQAGMWLATALRRLRGTTAHRDETPLWVVLGHVSALAAAAALRAGLDFTIDVPMRHGRVPLPTLGCAELPATAPWTTATVRSQAGRAVVEAAGATVAVPSAPESPGPGWYPLRRLEVGPAGRRLEVALDDVDPYRTYSQPTEPRPLSHKTAAQWRRVLERAWEVLLREQPETAGAMRRGILSISPTPPRERFRPRSVTSGDAFGGIEASEPDDPVQLAATLVHEFQHTKLGGLLHLAPLLTGDADDGKLFYAPWRDDPRPLAGMLQGVYAFTGITHFWHTHRRSAGERTAVAHFEFALWRTQTARALEQLRDHPRSTPLGTTLLTTLRDRCTRWLDEPVPSDASALARLCAADHAARWRCHHLRPPARAVAETVRAWLAGAESPPASLTARPEVVTDTSARWLDSLAMLVRHRLGPTSDDRPWAEEPGKAAAGVTGALPADVLLVDVLLTGGNATAAARAYPAHLAEEPRRPTAWAGLGRALALTRTAPAAARLLCHHPERARAVHEALVDATGTPPDPITLATWLGTR